MSVSFSYHRPVLVFEAEHDVNFCIVLYCINALVWWWVIYRSILQWLRWSLFWNRVNMMYVTYKPFQKRTVFRCTHRHVVQPMCTKIKRPQCQLYSDWVTKVVGNMTFIVFLCQVVQEILSIFTGDESQLSLLLLSGIKKACGLCCICTLLLRPFCFGQ